MERTEASRAARSVSSSARFITLATQLSQASCSQSKPEHCCPEKTRETERGKHTPRLDVHGDDRLGSGLRLALLLLAVLSQTLLTDTGSLGVLLLVVRAEQVDIVVVVSSGRGLGRVQGNLGDLGAVGGVGLGGIAGEGGELGLVGGDVLVPPGGVGVLGGVRRGGDGLEGGNVGLGGGVAIVGSYC